MFMKVIHKVTSGELLTKQAMIGRKLLNTKNIYILKLFLNIDTARIEAYVISGNKVLYACGKEVCHLSAQPHFDGVHQLLIIIQAL
jgi:hypothetical protein